MLDLITTIVKNTQQITTGGVKVVYDNIKVHKFITGTHERSNEFT